MLGGDGGELFRSGKGVSLEGKSRSTLSPALKFAYRTSVQRLGRLSMQSRPQEVVDWGHQRDSVPVITEVPEFHDKWVSWWGSCQPKWRSVDSWPFPHNDAKDRDWDRLNVTGPHGLFAVVMSTSWWAASGALDRHRKGFDAAVADLRWVIEHLLHFNSQLQATRPEPKAAPVNHFPGHGERDAGKRKIKPSSKACNRS